MNVIICDEDLLILSTIKRQMQECASDLIESIKCFSNIEKLLFYVENHLKESFVIYIGIEFNGEPKGIAVARRITELQPYSPIVFMSAYKDYFEEIYDVAHSFFLLKPFSNKRLSLSLTKAKEHVNEDSKPCYNILNKDALIRIEKQNIWMLENDSRKVYFYTSKGIEWSPKKIETIVAELESDFIQCHKSYAVNLRKVKSMEGSLFQLRNGLEVPISRSCHKKVKEYFLNFMIEN